MHPSHRKYKKEILTAWPVTSKERERLFLRRPSKSASRGVWFLLTTWRLRGRVQVTCRPGPSPVLLDRLSSEVACLSSGLGCLPRLNGKPLGGASPKDRLLFLGSRGDGAGGNRKTSTSRALERRRAAFTAIFWTPFRICCRSVETKGDYFYVTLSLLFLSACIAWTESHLTNKEKYY